MQEQRYDVTLPQIAAAFTPLYILPTLASANLGHLIPAHKKWMMIPIFIIYIAGAIALSFWAATKKHTLVVKDDEIAVDKTHFTPEEITSIRFTRRTLNIITRRFGKRGQVVFDKRDVRIAAHTISQFAQQHNIEIRNPYP